MNNTEFLAKTKESFYKYLKTGPRSNEKLKVLHGAIAKDLKERLGEEYEVHSLGYGNSKEENMTGRYMKKRVDISIEKNNEIIGAIALKFIMRNYSQNSNNYFENMLGETSNIRTTGKPYFQIIILPSQVPYFNKDKEVTKIEKVTKNNFSKYIQLSHDNISEFMHTPNKTLLYLIDIPIPEKDKIPNEKMYKKYYKSNNKFTITPHEATYDIGNTIIYNDYEKFIDKVMHYIKSM